MLSFFFCLSPIPRGSARVRGECVGTEEETEYLWGTGGKQEPPGPGRASISCPCMIDGNRSKGLKQGCGYAYTILAGYLLSAGTRSLFQIFPRPSYSKGVWPRKYSIFLPLYPVWVMRTPPFLLPVPALFLWDFVRLSRVTSDSGLFRFLSGSIRSAVKLRQSLSIVFFYFVSASHALKYCEGIFLPVRRGNNGRHVSRSTKVNLHIKGLFRRIASHLLCCLRCAYTVHHSLWIKAKKSLPLLIDGRLGRVREEDKMASIHNASRLSEWNVALPRSCF